MEKKNKIFFIEIFFLIFILSTIVAECTDSQIDINSASLEELQGITQIGEARAKLIISLRPFESVDDLSRVSGIGNGKRLEQIKTEKIACVEDEIVDEKISENSEDEDSEKENDDKDETEKKTEKDSVKIEFSEDKIEENNSPKTIVLNAQSIKSENDKEFSTKNLALFGVIGFCAVFGALFLLKKRKYKNEFQ